MERLCFGTFIDILAQCRNTRVSKGQLVNTVAKTIDSQSKYVNAPEPERVGGTQTADRNAAMYRALNHLYKCTGDFSPQYSSVVELAPKADRGEVIQKFRENVIPLIDPDMATCAVLALYDIIKKDATLNSDDGENILKFQKCAGGKTIQSFLNDTSYDLAEVLASIFLYTVTAVANTEGKEWLEKITEECKPKVYESYFKEYVNSFRSMASCIDSSTSYADTDVRAKPTQSLWEPGPEPVCMPDGFYESYEEHAIADFINLNPMKLNQISYMGMKGPSLEDLINNAIRFVRQITEVMGRVKITKKNRRFCGEVDIFIKILSEYINFILDNAPIPTNPPSLITATPYGIEGVKYTVIKELSEVGDKIYALDEEASREAIAEFDRKLAEFRANLQSQHEKINDCVTDLSQFTVYSCYDGPKYILKEP